MKRAAIIAIPFSLSFALGVLVWWVFAPKITLKSVPSNSTRPVQILSVPKIDFTEGAKKAIGLQASVKLRALLDGDGTVKDVHRFAMIPYGVPECFVGKGDFARYTHAMVLGSFVEELPYQLTDHAMDLIRGVKFIPQSVNDINESHWVTVTVDFNVKEPMGFPNCNAIDTTIFDDTGILWKGDASIYESCDHHNHGSD
jgi:hypothetical protein